MGLAFYSLIAAGLGSLFPISLRSGMSVLGIRFALGYALMVILTYVAHIILRLPLPMTLTISIFFCLAGFYAQWRRRKVHSDCSRLLIHPAFVLSVAGALVVTLNNGVGYIPYSTDEFSHVLATPRLIHLGDGWTNVVDSLHFPHYTPGWHLTLLMPWQLMGKEDFSLSAAAPFVLHITVIAVIYDIAIFVLRQKSGLRTFSISLLAWGFVLLFLAAQGMGRLWSTSLLYEQPQIYSYATIILLVYAVEVTGKDWKSLYGIAGIVLASAYLYKVAAVMFIPAIIGLSFIVLMNRVKSVSDRLKKSLLTIALLSGPILVAIVSWSVAVEAQNCSPLTLSTEQMMQVMSLDWMDLARRFGGAVWTYSAGYKTILSVAASIGVIGALVSGKYRAALMIGLVGIVYFLILYLFHLTCFGKFYFENLNSIPRFTRVFLQVFHTIGLVMLLDTVLSIANKKVWGPLNVLSQIEHHPRFVVVLIMIVGVLGAWQGYQLHYSVTDITTRIHQRIDPNINEIRRAANRIESLRGTVLPEKPLLTMVLQGNDNTIVNYATFFALDYRGGKVNPRFLTDRQMSWSPEPVNVWQTKMSTEEVVRHLAKADIIWPIKVDPWLLKALARLIPDLVCLNALPDRALIRDKTNDKIVNFKCIEK